MRNKTVLIKQELEALAEANNGLLRPEDVVNFAKNPATALHSRFEWDDTEAAQKYRLWQARQVIKVTVTVIPKDENEKEYRIIPVFQSLTPDRYNGGGYRTMVDIMTDEQMRKQLLSQAHNDFKLWQRKYQELKELVPVFDQMAKVMGEVETTLETIAA